MDFSKAFDSVPHNLLLSKLKQYGISGNLLKWFTSYLTNRYQRVTLDGHSSDWLPVLSGVPQGSILGPLLFLLYINDLPDVVKNSNVKLFADDTKFYSVVSDNSTCSKIQDDFSSLHEWSVRWRLLFNAKKCKVLSISRSKNPVIYNYTLNNISLERVYEFVDLGIVVDSSLCWNKQVDKIISTANKMLGLIKRSVGFKAPKHVKKQLYISLVRSQLEYCTSAWSGTTKHNVTNIERVQRTATRYILDYPDMSYKARLKKLNLLPLSYRRDITDVNFMFKCLNNIYDVDLSNYVKFTKDSTVNTRNSADATRLCVPQCRTSTFMKSYFNRISYTWNSLPSFLRSCNEFLTFKRQLCTYCFNTFNSNFNVDDFNSWFLA
jgi:hypothetical protein